MARRPAKRLLVVPQRRQALERLVLHATSLRIPIVEVEGGTLTAVAGFDGHQGIALVVEPRVWASPDQILARAVQRGEPPFVLVLDSLEDPQNVGTLLRSAEAAGVHGVIFPTHRQAPLTPAAVKASAGAVEHLLLCPVDDLPGALSDLRVRGVRIAAAEAEAPLTAAQADLRGPLAIVVGSEGQGLAPAVRRRADLGIRIPMRGAIGSLNASVAGSILLFAAVAQRDPLGATAARAGLPVDRLGLVSEDAAAEGGDATTEPTADGSDDAAANAEPTSTAATSEPGTAPAGTAPRPRSRRRATAAPADAEEAAPVPTAVTTTGAGSDAPVAPRTRRARSSSPEPAPAREPVESTAPAAPRRARTPKRAPAAAPTETVAGAEATAEPVAASRGRKRKPANTEAASANAPEPATTTDPSPAKERRRTSTSSRPTNRPATSRAAEATSSQESEATPARRRRSPTRNASTAGAGDASPGGSSTPEDSADDELLPGGPKPD